MRHANMLSASMVVLFASASVAAEGIESENGQFKLRSTIVEHFSYNGAGGKGLSSDRQVKFSHDGTALIATYTPLSLYYSEAHRFFRVPGSQERFSIQAYDLSFALSSKGVLAVAYPSHTPRESRITLRQLPQETIAPDLLLNSYHADLFMAVVCSSGVPEVRKLPVDRPFVELNADEGIGDLGNGLWRPSPRLLTFTPDGATLITQFHFHEDELASFEFVQIWDVPSRSLKKAFRKSNETRVVLAPDGMTLAYGLEEGTTEILDMESLQVKKELSVSTIPHPLCFTPDGKRLLTTEFQSDTIVMWDAETWVVVDSLKMPEREVWAASFSPVGDLLTVGYKDGSLYLFDYEAK